MRCDLRRAAAPLLAAAALAGCSSIQEPRQVACPEVLILGDTQRITKFRDGPGRDITDVEAEAEIAGFKGTCTATDAGLELALQVGMEVSRGAADGDGEVDLVYFVALPDFYPSPQAKAVFPIRVAFPPNTAQVRVMDEEVTLTIPDTADAGAASRQVLVGFQLSPEQLEYNRRLAR